MLRIGVQTSILGGVNNAVESEKEKTGNCGQIFSHSPQSWDKPSLGDEEIQKFKSLVEEYNMDPWVIHTSYLINLCSPKDELRRKSIESVQDELYAAEELGIKFVNTHLGAHTGAGVEDGLDNAVDSIDQLDIPDGVQLLIETDSGSGTNMGDKFEELQQLQDRTENQIGFCIDTAHIWAAGYDISTTESASKVYEEFDDIVGLESLGLIHLNDSKHDVGTYRDEHQHLCEGKIGEKGIKKTVEVAGKNNIPLIAETPITDEKGDPWNLSIARDMWEESKD